ncbi:hypothetical protein AMS68_003521 [Peltaster fructicola]|uniref:CAP-Gly domain-containing protein n=1 Tax=Peltaster fructicola TaxID=286661 RepID=A0A6H0XTE1_9PEZI|nr:hypothetical protein AMS68_003521 [Peltaster fructicola]
MTSYSVGQKVELNDGRVARVRFVGTTSFQTGDWIGVELDEETGKNDGSVKGDRYFTCEQGHGMFVRPTGVRTVLEDAPKAVKRLSSANGTAAGAKVRPGSLHAAVNGVKKTDASHRRTSTISATPTPAARTSRLSSIRSPTKSPTKQLGINGSSSTSTSRTSTPPVAVARKPGAPLAARPRPSLAPGASVTHKATSTTRASRTSLAPATSQRAAPGSALARTAAPPSTVRQPLRKTAEEPEEHDFDDQNVTNDANEDQDDSQDADKITPLNFAPPSAPSIPPDQGRNTARRASSPSASVHSQRTVRGTGVSTRYVEELEAKIKLYERKRLEERDEKKTLDQARQERDKYQGIIEKLQKKYQPQQQEIVDLKKALAAAESKSVAVEDLQAEHDTIMEMATLDKEMAEETAEALKAELDALRSRLEEQELELEVLREENDEFSKDMSSEERTSAGWLQLEKENQRLRDALLRLRDLTQDREEELKSKIAELQSQVKDFEKLSSQLEDTKERLLISESNAEDLRQQLEAALGAEEMIEELTGRNMGLTGRIDELNNTIEDLENLRELNDELEINHIEAEKQLQEEIDFKDALIQDRDTLAKQQQSALDDADYTINRFRELVTQLQSDLQDMRASKQISETEAADLESRSRAMMDLNLRLQTSAAKTQVKTIELELRKMEADEAAEHLGIVQLFLPDSFQAERDSVLALLRFRRVSFKATLLQTFVKERMSSYGAHNREENVFASTEVYSSLTWISATADRFVKALCMCSMEEFAKYESAQYELDPVERALTTYIDAIRRDDVREDDMAKELQRSIAVMTHLASIHIGNELPNHADELTMKLSYLQSQLEGIASAFTGMKVLIEASQKPTDGESEDEDEADAGFIVARAEALSTQARSIRVVLGKTSRALSDLQDRHMTLEPGQTDSFDTTETLTQTISRYAVTVGEQLRSLFNEEGREEPVSAHEISSAIVKTATSSFDLPAPEAGPFSTVLGQLRALSDSVADLAALPNDLDHTVEVSRAPAPWVARAEQLKKHKLTAQDTEEMLARANESLRERDVTIRSKESELEEQSVRIEMLEARMREASKRSARVTELERAVHEAKDNERRAKQELERSKREATHELERVQEELARAAQRGKRGASVSQVDGNAMGPEAQLTMKRQEHQITSLESAVRYLKEENTRLQMPTRTAPQAASKSVAWLYEPLLKSKSEKQQRDAALQKTGREILQNLQAITLAPYHVDLTTLPENKLAWRSVKKSSRWQLERRKEEWATWQGWRDEFIHDVSMSRRGRQAAH